jgi:hypothetical protein
MFGFICSVIAYIGVIRFQIKIYQRGKLTEARFVLLQVTILSLLAISASLTFLPTGQAQFIGIGATVLCLLVGIPTAQWVYRKFLQNKS